MSESAKEITRVSVRSTEEKVSEQLESSRIDGDYREYTHIVESARWRIVELTKEIGAKRWGHVDDVNAVIQGGIDEVSVDTVFAIYSITHLAQRDGLDGKSYMVYSNRRGSELFRIMFVEEQGLPIRAITVLGSMSNDHSWVIDTEDLQCKVSNELLTHLSEHRVWSPNEYSRKLLLMTCLCIHPKLMLPMEGVLKVQAVMCTVNLNLIEKVGSFRRYIQESTRDSEARISYHDDKGRRLFTIEFQFDLKSTYLTLKLIDVAQI